MNNKKYIQQISKKNNLKLRRNSSLESTKSSLRVKKIQLYNEFTPFVKNTQNQGIKNIIDFPMCMSLFTNNYSQTDKDIKTKNKSSNNLNINFRNLKNNIFQKNNRNELVLPATKKIISRNPSKLFIHSFSPVNSVIKSSILNHNKLQIQSFRNIQKPKIQKINYSSLTNINKRKQTDNGIKVLKKLNNQKIYNLSNSSIEQEISTIPHINYNININEKKKFNLPLNFFTPKDNGGKKEYIILPTTRTNINKKKGIQRYIIGEEINNNTKQNNALNKVINDILLKYNINKIEDSKNADKLELKNTIKISNQKFEQNKNESKYKNIKNKIKEEKNKKGFKSILKKKETFSIKQINDNKNKEITKKEKNEKIPINLKIEKEKLIKIKDTKFYLAVNSKQTKEIYNNNFFLNDYYKKINEKTKNNNINIKIFLQKTEMLIKDKELIKNMIVRHEKKLKEIETVPLSQATKKNIMAFYLNKIVHKRSKKVSFMKIISFNDSFNGSLCYASRYHLLNTIEFGEVNLTNSSNNNINKNNQPKKRGSAIQNINRHNNIKIVKRQNTFFTSKKIYINSDLEDAFTLQKTKNNIKKDLKVKHNPINLMSIQNYILKSLPYFEERYFMEQEYNYITKKNNNIKGRNNNKSYSRKTSGKFGSVNNLIKYHLSSQLVKGFKKKNTLIIDDKFTKPKKRIGKIFNLDDFTKSFKKQISKKSIINMEHYSVLQKKNFFKKRIIKERVKEPKKSLNNLIRKDSIDSNIGNIYNKENENNDENEEQINYDEIYFELIKLVIEGKNKNFEKYYESKKNFIDINQELYEGNTLLLLCVKEGNFFITKFLCERGAEINRQNNDGNTALHYAIGKQFYAIADILTRYGAREDIKNIRGLTPWDCIENNIE